MNDQLEHDLAAAFGEHAGGAVDTDVLADAATRRGRRLRARAYTVRCAAAAAVVAVVAAGVATMPESSTAPQPGQASASTPAELDWTRQPPPGGWSVPAPVTAAVPADPSKVGTDPSLLHFTVDAWAVDATYTTWRSAAGIETILFRRGDAVYQVSVATNPDLLDEELQRVPAGDSPFPRWQLAPGLWAQVYGHGGTLAEARRIQSGVRLDTTLRCVSPVQLNALPAGARLLSCETTLAGTDLPGRLMFSTLRVGENTVDQAEITVQRRRPAPSPGTLTIGGRQARVYTDDRFRPSVEFPDVAGLRIQVAGTGTYKAPELILIAEGIGIASDSLDPVTWSDRLVA